MSTDSSSPEGNPQAQSNDNHESNIFSVFSVELLPSVSVESNTHNNGRNTNMGVS